MYCISPPYSRTETHLITLIARKQSRSLFSAAEMHTAQAETLERSVSGEEREKIAKQSRGGKIDAI